MNDLQKKWATLGDALKGAFFERDRVIEGLIVALLARQHVLLLGPPGTAKSALANVMCKAIEGAGFFEWLLSRMTAPEELFGPVKLSGLKADKYERNTANKAPEAEIVFYDEIFKGSSTILNTNLKLINERKFDNGGAAPMDVPLEMMVGASNELPEGGATGELAPLFDRFLVRYWVEPLKADNSFVGLLADEDEEGNATDAEPEIPATARVTMADLKAAQAEVAKVRMTRDAAEKMAQLRRELAGKGVQASDRRWKQACKALRANAWLSGDSVVTEDHFTILADCLWDDPEQRREVAITVQQFCGEQVGEALKTHDALVDLITNMPANGGDRQTQVPLVTREGKRAEEVLKALREEASSASNKQAIDKLLAQITSALQPLRKEARAALGI